MVSRHVPVPGAPRRLENREGDAAPGIRFGREAEQRVDAPVVFVELQVPAARFVPAKSDAAVGDVKVAGGRVVHHGFPIGVIRLQTQCPPPAGTGRAHGAVIILENDDEGQIGVRLWLREIGLAFDVELFTMTWVMARARAVVALAGSQVSANLTYSAWG